MEQSLENYNFGKKDGNVESLIVEETNMVKKSNKCNQCNFASSRAQSLKRHLKTHSGEKSNKCNQCDYASSQAGNLMRHRKTHTLEKS